MLAAGESKFLAKQDGTVKDKIFSFQTYHDYKDICYRFADYCKSKGCKTLEECEQYAAEWITRTKPDGKVYSAHTQKTYACAIGKLFGCSLRELVGELPERRRADIKNSRGKREYYSRQGKYRDVIRFVCDTGLRHKELLNLRGTDILEKGGKLYVNVHNGKGGKDRTVPVFRDQQWVRDLMEKAGSGKVFSKVPDRFHRYRAEYANDLYRLLARENIPRGERYYCRGDLKGVVYDKRAMRIVSKALGHNRIGVIAQSYLRSI